jgi:hypothetical protein
VKNRSVYYIQYRGFQIITPRTRFKSEQAECSWALKSGLTQRRIMKMFLFRKRHVSVSVSLCAKTLRTLVLIYYCCYEITKTSQNELYLLHIHSYKEFTSACKKLRRCTEACIHQSRFYNVTAVSTDNYFKRYLWVGLIRSNGSTWASFLLRLGEGTFFRVAQRSPTP